MTLNSSSIPGKALLGAVGRGNGDTKALCLSAVASASQNVEEPGESTFPLKPCANQANQAPDPFQQ